MDDRIAELEHTVGLLACYAYELALLAEQSGHAIADLRKRPNVVVNVVVVVDKDDGGGWRVVRGALESGSGLSGKMSQKCHTVGHGQKVGKS